jgi:guanylate kinase
MSDVFLDREVLPLLVILSGTAGAGKDTVLRRMKERDIPFAFVVTATSRKPRPGEVDGEDYQFVSEAEFKAMIRDDDLLEHAVVYGQHKGIPKSRVRAALATGKDVVLRIDVQGADAIRRLYPQAVTIFLVPPSEEELTRRLLHRGSDPSHQVALRLRAAREEMKRIPGFDYVVINADGRLDEAVDTIACILRAEHARAVPRKISL